MTRSIRIVLLLVAGVCLFSAVGYSGEAAAPAPAGGPQVAKIVTSDGRMLVGEVLADNKDGVRILDLRSGAEVTVAVETIKVRENALATQEAIKWVGLPSYLAWRIKKESELNSKGKIITVTPTTVYLSLGQRDGVEKGDKVNVYRESETLSDPDTGEVLGKVRARIGELEVTEVEGKFSKARRLSELEVEYKVGDVAESTKTKKAVAVFPIVPAKDDQQEMAMLVTERFTTELASRGVPLVERALLDHALIEMGLQTTALVDQDKAAKLGQLIGAQSILTGTLGSVTAGKVEVHTRLIRVSTGEVLVAGSEELRVEVPKTGAVQSGTPAPQAGGRVLRIEALVDGEVWLVLQGNQMHWETKSWNVPGARDREHPDGPFPTLVDSRAWQPVWNGQNSAPIQLSFTLPVDLSSISATVKTIQGRSEPTVMLKGGALIVDINDTEPGSDRYVFELYIREVGPGVAAQQPPAASPADTRLRDELRTRVTLRAPYPKSYADAPTDRMSLQYAVIEIAAQAGLGYDWDTSYKNTDPVCRNWVHPDIRNVQFANAMDDLLGPQGLTYSVVNNQVVLRRK